MSTLKTRVVGLTALLALLLLVAGIPALLVAIGAVPRVGDFTLDRLTSPDDGTVAVAVIGLAAWLAWLVFAASVTLDLLARVRGIRPPGLPGLAAPQRTAGRLIALAALLFVAVPATPRSLPTSQARTIASHQTTPATTSVTLAAPSRPDANAKDVRVEPARTPTVAYTVRRGDSLWKIAQEHLGDGRRYREIVALNGSALHGQPDFITPGTVLRIPAPPPPKGSDNYVVQPGDTLSEIAADRLGDPTAYDRILDASRQTVQQPGGERLTDPDMIRPGWNLTIPRNRQPVPAAPPAGSEPVPRPTALPTGLQRPQIPVEATPSPPAPRATDAQTTASAVADRNALPSWAFAGLAGGGAVLAGSLLLVLRQHRRTQQRYRRPGRVIAPPPPELRAVEKSAHLVGTVTAPKIDVLDRALRHLATVSLRPPRVHLVELGDTSITLHLVHPSDLPAPWRGGRTIWTLALDGECPEPAGESAPYPLLVSIGLDDGGALVLVNLEELRSVTVTGPPELAIAFGRHLAAELALNPWAALVDIEIVGIAGELVRIDPMRLHHHRADDAAFLTELAAELVREPASDDPDQFRALIAAVAQREAETIRVIAQTVAGRAGRPAAAVVAVNSEPGAEDVEFHLTAAGRLRAADLGLDLMAAGLTVEEAAACAAIVEGTREVDDASMPVARTFGEEKDALEDQAGAVRVEATEPRPAGVAGPRSLLPETVETYTRKAATTSDDILQLAPIVSTAVQDTVAERDPGLDDDLDRWVDPALLLPRLTMLGPVGARTAGEARTVAHRKPFYVELLAYLALHPRGVTTAEVCDAFGLTPDRARTDLAVVRRWLGTNPRTGAPHLPSARTRQHSDRRGLPLYQLDGVLTDLDLFRRLRTRGQSRGAEGMDDLVRALRLVTGEPFTGLRPAGWSWLLDGDRIDHIMTCAIVDVAHIVTTHALTIGDFELARLAAETAYRAAPDDETSHLDMIDVAAATGHAELAQRHLVQALFNRSDDDLGPTALPDRTARIARQRGWDAPQHRGRT